MNKMRSIYIVGPTGPTGGISRYVAGQQEHLSDSNYNVSVHETDVPSGSGIIWLIRAVVLSIFDALKFPFVTRADVYHIHTSHGLSFFRASFYVLFTRYVWRRPVVLHVHGSSFDEFVDTDLRLLTWYQTKVFAATCRVIVLSSYWEDVLSPQVSPDKIETIPNATDPSDYNPEWNDSIAHVVFISNLIGRKGVRELIEAVHRVHQSSSKEYCVTIAGKGPLSSNVEDLAAEIDCVDYRGFVSEREKRSILESGSIYVLPSYAEGLPIAILEGMTGGNAIISTTVGSIPEVVNKNNGITVEPRDVDGLESAIRELIADPERTEKMGRRSRKLAEKRYCWEYVVNRLKKVYRDCVDERYST